MGLICCPDCGKEICKNAVYCMYCGCPLSDAKHTEMVSITLPKDVIEGLAKLFFKKNITIQTTAGKSLWTGKQGETAEFSLDRPTRIIIHFGSVANPVEDIIQPGKQYELTQVGGIHWKQTYLLSEKNIQ